MKNIIAFSEEIKRGQSAEEHTHKILEEAAKINADYNYFNTLASEQAIKQAKELDQKIKQNKRIGFLAGIPLSVKDAIVTKGIESTGGSKILKGYVPLFNATSVQQCIDEDAIIIGKTSQDEFGFGSFSVNTGKDFPIPKNPFDVKRVAGGSSGGAAGFTQKTKYSHAALAESTGGSIESPSSFCGVVGFCPTYGLVSRYGLIDYGNSFDKIGPMTKTVEECAFVLNAITGHDKKDSTSVMRPKEDYLSFCNEEHSSKKVRIAVISESMGEGVQDGVKKTVLQALQKADLEYDKVELPFVQKYALPTYYLLAMSEASTNLAKYCGMRYGMHEELKGTFNEYFTKVRSNNFGAEAKRRVILGTFARMAGFRDAYYLKATKVRTKIIEEYKKMFKKYDVILSPTMPITAPTFEEIAKLTPLQNYLMDILTVGPNLAGLPHMNVPVGFDNNLPVGLQLIGDHFTEGKLFSVGKRIEENLMRK